MTTASVPGKLILLGEHAAVYGRPALVAAVGLRLTATVEDAPAAEGAAGVRIRLGGPPAIAADATLGWEEVLAHAGAARAAWQRYSAAPGPATFAAPGPATFAAIAGPAREGGALHLLKIALAEAALQITPATPRSPSRPSRGEGDAPSHPSVLTGRDLPRPVVLTVDSEIPVGSGFGSSAAAAVGVVLAYLAHRGVEPDPDLLHRVSLEVERRQHGSPSGVDNATVIRGGILEARRTESGVEIDPVPVRSPALGSMRVFGTGLPAESTGTVVAAVRALRDRQPERVDAALDRLAELTGDLRAELERPDERPDEVTGIVREAEARLEELGVVPEPVRRLVRQIEQAGGAAKISGAGSLAGPAAGNLIVYHPEPERAAEWPFLRGLDRYDVELGAPGARIEGEKR